MGVPAGFRHRAGVPRLGCGRGVVLLAVVLVAFWTAIPAFAQGQVSPGESKSAQLDQRLWVRGLFALTIFGMLGVLGWRLRVWQRENER